MKKKWQNLSRTLLPLSAMVLCHCMGPVIPRPTLPVSSTKLAKSEAPPGTILRTVVTTGLSEEVPALYHRKELSVPSTAWDFDYYRKRDRLIPPGLLLRVTGIWRDYEPWTTYPFKTRLTILSGKFAGENVIGNNIHHWSDWPEPRYPVLTRYVKIHQAAPAPKGRSPRN